MAITAKQAETLTKRGINKLKRAERAAELKADRELKRRQRKTLKEGLPFALVRLEKKIREATAAGEHTTHWSFSNHEINYPLIAAFVHELEARKFKVSKEVSSGSENMGDFNAPCTVYYNNIIVHVSW